MKFDYSPVAYTGQFWIQENRSLACAHCAMYFIDNNYFEISLFQAQFKYKNVAHGRDAL